jgi:hypothetical protein
MLVCIAAVRSFSFDCFVLFISWAQMLLDLIGSESIGNFSFFRALRILKVSKSE